MASVTVVSYALLPKVLPELCAGPRYDVVIADECQALKNPAAARTQAIYAQRGGLINHGARFWLLSGTPAPNHPGELWVPCYSLFGHPLKRQAFIDRFCITRATDFGEQIVGANLDRLPELAAFLAPHMLQRRQEDVLADLPPLRWGHIPVSPGSVPPQPELGIDIAAVIEKLTRGGALSMDEQTHLETLRRWAGLAKVPPITELIQGELKPIDKIVAFAVHREVIAGLAAGLGSVAAAIDGSTPQAARQRLIDAFQHDDLPKVLILQINTAGTAITLHRSNRVFFAETSWTPADIVQAAKRCHRIGQTKSVLASVVSLAGSIDERIAAIITRKTRELAELEYLIHKENVA